MGRSQHFGFLVVLSLPTYRNPRNARYRGVDRVPEYPASIIEEAEALDEYVFGDYKDIDTNLIPDLCAARRLLGKISISGRQFEIIVICSSPVDSSLTNLGPSIVIEELGYDVAGISGGYWSIVADVPAARWAETYIASFNQNGLFCTREQAEHYLNDYRAHQEPDYDSPFAVVFVARVTDNENE
jgi:hypothetical protein